MKQRGLIFIMLLMVLSLSACSSSTSTSNTSKQSEPPSTSTPGTTPSSTGTPTSSPAPATSQTPAFNPPVHFNYPDAVRGIYVTGWSAGGDRMPKLLSLVDNTDLNAMVIDIKDDDGYITFKPEGKLAEFGQPYIKDPKALMKTLEQHKIYPIARIVSFKDTVLAKKRPDLSYIDGTSVWRNAKGDGFINPFLKETWDHDVDAAKLAAELGFKEIQFDYVRFPEGFESRDKVLKYSMGDYQDKKPTKFVQEEKDYAEATKKYQDDLTSLQSKLTDATNTYDTAKTDANKKAMDVAQKSVSDLKIAAPQAPDFSDKARMTQLRVDAVSDFVAYAKEQLKPYGVKVSVDIFGYSATLPEAPGIGQNFSRISNSVDVISSMIYPSHWSAGYFGIAKPDKEPYKLVAEYIKREKEKFAQLQTPPTSRPWIQDFTASWLGSGNYLKYGKAEVDAQIKALKDSGINEYLIWNANNSYSDGVTYKS
ncbi:putative glycoside hydrolase [Paenibacillus sp. GP183]|uniref:putative glycoside hydrolase n=1 Tax=Paenibacillus sp. GP183 TaxID=1882751 RepID=UPI0008962C01|nr:putative glycoside hydrolase [Paenibacillus sp. GP183]SEB93976.1 Putative glycosyl hydrolase domain-containing protein [Paenibacillus sp. GP183]